MAKPILKFKVNQQSAEVGGKFYGIIEDTPVTPENSILQICEFKKITAFTPEQVLRLVEDVCDGAAKLVARDGQSRQLSSLLKFSPRVRGTFNAVDARWSDQKLIVGARLLKDIKLNMNPNDFVMSNVADVGTLQSGSILVPGSAALPSTVEGELPQGSYNIRINGANLGTWDATNTKVRVAVRVDGEVYPLMSAILDPVNPAVNGFNVVWAVETPDSVATLFDVPSEFNDKPFEFVAIVYHPAIGIEFKQVTLVISD